MSTHLQNHKNSLSSSRREGSLTLQNGQFYDSEGRAIGKRVHPEQSIDIALAQSDQHERLERLRGSMRELAKVAVTNWHEAQTYIASNLSHYSETYKWLGKEIDTLTAQSRDLEQLHRKDADHTNLLRSHYVGFRTELIIPALYMQLLLQQPPQSPSSLYIPASEAADNLAVDSLGLRQAYDATVLQFDTSNPENTHAIYDFSRVQIKTGKNKAKRYAAHIALVEFIGQLPRHTSRDRRANLEYVAENISANAADSSRGDTIYLDKIRQNIDNTVTRHIRSQVAEARK